MGFFLQAKHLCLCHASNKIQTFKAYFYSKQIMANFCNESIHCLFSSPVIIHRRLKLPERNYVIQHKYRKFSPLWTCKCSCSQATRKEKGPQFFENATSHSEFQMLHSHHAESLLNPPMKNLMERVVDKAPTSAQPYLTLARLNKPIGTWLLLWPCYWSLGLAASPGELPAISLLAIFGFGALTMRSAGCTINDMWDKNIDKQVVRTQNRPLSSGRLTSTDATVFLAGELAIALLLLLQLNWPTVLIGSSSLLLVVVYPLMKRITYWPQIMLGLTFNWGGIMGWTAIHGSCNWAVVLPLYLAGISWTMIYDTIYAHQDKNDDVLINVKSTALKFGKYTRQWLTGFSGSMLACLGVTGFMCNQTWPYYAAVGLTGLHLAHQIATLNIDDSEDCWKKFKSNQWIGLILCIGIFAGNLMKKKDISDQANDSLIKEDQS